MWIVPDRRVCAATQGFMGFATQALALNYAAPKIGPSGSAICAHSARSPAEIG